MRSTGVPECYHSALTETEQLRLNDAAYEIRNVATRIISMCRWGHIGGSYSIAELLAVLYGKAARLTPQTTNDPTRDRIVLSKAHTSPALYAAMYHFGYLAERQLYTYGTINGLDGHLRKDHPAGVECSGGSLGLGLCYSVGLACALKQKECCIPRVFCILGDGELNEGEIWEGAMSAAQFGLDNLIVLVDDNKVMAKGMTSSAMGVQPLEEKFRAFGFCVQSCDGHDVNAIWSAIYRARYVGVCGKPHVILANTVKGRGVAECEFHYKWHTHAPDRDTANRFLRELAEKWKKPYEPIQRIVKPKDPGLAGVLMGEG